MMIYPDNQRHAARLHKLFEDIGQLQREITAAGNTLDSCQDGFEEILENLDGEGKVKPVNDLLEDMTASLTEDERRQFHEITDAYINMSQTYVIFFCAAMEAFSFLSPDQSGLCLQDLIFVSNSVREIQAAISTGKAHIDEMNDEPDAHIRIEELERALRQCLAPKSDTTSCTINQHDWFTLSLLRWCQWVRSVGFSTTQFLSTFEVMDAPIQREKLVEAIHKAQVLRLVLVYASQRSSYLAKVWADEGKACAISVYDGTAEGGNAQAASKWANGYRAHSPALDYAVLKAGLDALDRTANPPSCTQDDLPFDVLVEQLEAKAVG